MKILGIETSCDETGIAIYDTEVGLLSHILYSQIPLHADYGGVVPELASRDHIRKTIPLIHEALTAAKLKGEDLDGIAYTAGPGLLGALLVGATIGQTLAFSWNIPAIAIHHMEAHLLAPLLETDKPTFPFLALLVSGGHTLLVKVTNLGQYEILGESLDDAAGEAFDKTAKILGLDYPGGPALARLAEFGDENRFTFPRPMTDRPGLDFSFSGLKTAALHAWQSSDQSDKVKADIAASFQRAVVDTLAIKCERAMKQTDLTQLVMAGGVSANKVLRALLKQSAKNHGWRVFYPRPEFCTDNGAMIAFTGALRLQAGFTNTDSSIRARSRWSITDLS